MTRTFSWADSRMTIRANPDLKFIRRYLWVAVVGFGLFAWGLWDANFKFPKELEMAEAFDQVSDSDDPEKAWRELFEANEGRGWSRERPEKSAAVIEGYIRFNMFVTYGGLALGIFFALKYVWTRGSWIESTENGVKTSWGNQLQFDQITRINKRKWEDKGIARIFFTDETGRKRKIIFDDFKYEQKPMGQLMELCEAGRSADVIVGGKSQAEIAEEIRLRAEMDEYEDSDQEDPDYDDESERSLSSPEDSEKESR